jgi:hypothetical protein
MLKISRDFADDVSSNGVASGNKLTIAFDKTGDTRVVDSSVERM